MIRAREITSFMESHTVHATWNEAEAQVESEIALTRKFTGVSASRSLSRNALTGTNSPARTIPLRLILSCPMVRPCQIGTVHHLGDHFSRTFSILYEDKNGEQKVAYQTCYGISERCIAALISVHGDDKGLILPTAVATLQVVIVPITIGNRHEDVIAAAEKLKADLETARFPGET